MNALPNPCLRYVRQTVPGFIPEILWRWAKRLCSWNLPQHQVARFVYEAIYGKPGDQDEGIDEIVKAILQEDASLATDFLAQIDIFDANWQLWMQICGWVNESHLDRAHELLPALLQMHRDEPFPDLKTAQGAAEQWLFITAASQVPERSIQPRKRPGPR